MYIRVYSGELKPGENYLNTTNGKKERIARFYRMMGDKRISLEKAGPGDIVAAMGLADTFTGNTLCDPDEPVRAGGHPVPQAGHRGSRLQASASTARYLANWPRALEPARARRPDDQRPTPMRKRRRLILSGMGELHLEISH